MEIRILGPLEVTDGTRVLEPGGFRQRALLARLAVAANRVVAVDAVVEELWGPEAPPGAKQALQSQASRIRRALGDGSRLVARAPGYLLRLEPEELDAARFEALINRARAAAAAHDLEAATELWSRAEALWRGPALEEFGDYSFAQAEAARLAEIRLGAIEARVEAELALGRHDQLVAELEALVGSYPYRERLWAHLLVALYRSGRQADALSAYRRLRTILGEELGITPGPGLVRLEEAMLLQKPELTWVPPFESVDRRGTPDGVSKGGARAGLPTYRSTFIGRDEELAQLHALVQGGGLVTLVGPGGIGKTRLAIELAGRLGDAFGERRFVELAPLADPELVPHEIAQVCGVREKADRDPVETLVEALQPRSILLVLDNCEHVVDAAARVTDAILRGTAGVSILATSREPLRVDGERIRRTVPLSVPAGPELTPDDALRFDSVRLFESRAADADERFAVSSSNAAAIALICRGLDGIPLAIELAAARVGAIGPSELAARLDDRFRLLRVGSRAVAPRHQTLEAAIAWSYDLCSHAEQRLFCRLSVFSGGFTLAAAEAVCSDDGHPSTEVVEVLGALVDRSLVLVQPVGGDARYDLLESLRTFGHERLRATPELAIVQDRHLSFYADLATQADLAIRPAMEASAADASQREWLDLLELEHDNLRAALQHALRIGRAIPLASALATFWELRNHVREGQSWLSRAVAGQGGKDCDRLRGFKSLGVLHMRSGDYAKAHELFELVLAQATELGDAELVAGALTALAGLAGLQADLPLARRLNEDALAHWRRLANEYEIAWTLGALSWVASAQNRFATATDLQEQSLHIRRELGDNRGVAWALASLARVHIAVGQGDEARRYLAESVELSRQLGHRSDTVVALIHLGELERATGNRSQARALLEDSATAATEVGSRHLALWAILYLAAVAHDEGGDAEVGRLLLEATPLAVSLQNRLAVVEILELEAHAACRDGRYVDAACALGAASAIRDAIGAPVAPYRRRDHDRTCETLREQLGVRSAAAMHDRGRAIGRRGMQRKDMGTLIGDVHDALHT